MYVKDYLEKKYGDQMLENGGLKVYTTLDWDKQQIAEKANDNEVEVPQPVVSQEPQR